MASVPCLALDFHLNGLSSKVILHSPIQLHHSRLNSSLHSHFQFHIHDLEPIAGRGFIVWSLQSLYPTNFFSSFHNHAVVSVHFPSSLANLPHSPSIRFSACREVCFSNLLTGCMLPSNLDFASSLHASFYAFCFSNLVALTFNHIPSAPVLSFATVYLV